MSSMKKYSSPKSGVQKPLTAMKTSSLSSSPKLRPSTTPAPAMRKSKSPTRNKAPSSSSNSPTLSPKRSPQQQRASDFEKHVKKNDIVSHSGFWDAIAPEYDDEILSTIETDKTKHILEILKKHADTKKVAVDFGCGVGKYLPTLSKHFLKVLGLDFSEGLLDQAERKCKKFTNVEILRPAISLTETKSVEQMIKAKLPVNHQCVDFGVCANVLLSPEKNVQVGILETIHKCLKPKGVLFLLVPALESHLFGLWAVQHGPGKECSQLVKGIDKYNAKMSRQDLLNGIVKRGDQEVRTQHYIKEQIIEMVNSVGFDVLHTTKAEFTWDTEIDFDCISNNTSQAAVEKKFKKLNSGPFDWILVLRKE